MRMRWCCNAREVGQGETTVVLAHGYGANQGLWDKLVPSLSRTCKVLLFDWDFITSRRSSSSPSRNGVGVGLGVGEDDDNKLDQGGAASFGRFADDLIELMDERKVRGAVLVGHSMSAMAGCIASVRRPDLFAHLVLLCASPRYMDDDDSSDGYVGGFQRSSIDSMLEAMSSDFQAWVRGFVPNAAGGDPDSITHLNKSFLAMRPAVALQVARMIFLGDQREVLDAVATPCTLVQVKADFVAPPCVAEYMRRRLVLAKTVEVEIIDSVGHFPQLVAHQQLLHILHAVLLQRRC